MNMTPKVIFTTALTVVLSSCGGPATTPSKTATTERSVGSDTKKPSASGANASCTVTTATNAALALAGSVGYTDTAKAVITRNCVSCHGAGGTMPDLSSYAAASAAAKASLQAITAARMPPPTASIKMTTADQNSFAAWVAGGSLQSSTAAAVTTANPTPAAPSATTPAAPTPVVTSSPSAPATQCPPVATAPATPITIANTSMSPATAAAVMSTASSIANGAGTTSGTSAATTTGSSAAPTYTANLKVLLQAHCTSCHSPGGPVPDLTTYAGVKGAAAISLDDIVSGSMPKGSAKLSATDTATFQAWVNGGFQQ